MDFWKFKKPHYTKPELELDLGWSYDESQESERKSPLSQILKSTSAAKAFMGKNLKHVVLFVSQQNSLQLNETQEEEVCNEEKEAAYLQKIQERESTTEPQA